MIWYKLVDFDKIVSIFFFDVACKNIFFFVCLFTILEAALYEVCKVTSLTNNSYSKRKEIVNIFLNLV